jgi:hypothetical protein
LERAAAERNELADGQFNSGGENYLAVVLRQTEKF